MVIISVQEQSTFDFNLNSNDEENSFVWLAGLESKWKLKAIYFYQGKAIGKQMPSAQFFQTGLSYQELYCLFQFSY